MKVRVTEGEIAGMRWLGVRGERTEAFRALGAAARDDVAAVLDGVVARGGVRDRADAAPDVVDRVVAATERLYPTQLAELSALAEGAGADPYTVLLANLRGDLGRRGGTGCSDLGWRRARSFVAHNEDGGVETNLTMLTLAVDDEPPVAVEWYPGMLPANSFVVTGHGLVWGIDHLPVDDPHDGAGRHFVARGAQRSTSVGELVAYLRAHPSAGGFAYTAGAFGTGEVATVEAAGGEAAAAYAGGDDPLLWHTNHLRYVGAPSTASRNSLDRGCLLDALEPPTDEPDTAWFLDRLGGAPLPDGVRQQGERGMTLCTAVADLDVAELTFLPPGGTPATLTYDALLAGP